MATILESNHCDSGRELGIRFALWAHGLTEIPSADRIRVHFRMSRATAYRWRRAFCDAIGVDPPLHGQGRSLTAAELMRARKAAAGLVRVSGTSDACRSCEFFRTASFARWGNCTRHHFRVQGSHGCNAFKSPRSTSPAATGKTIVQRHDK